MMRRRRRSSCCFFCLSWDFCRLALGEEEEVVVVVVEVDVGRERVVEQEDYAVVNMLVGMAIVPFCMAPAAFRTAVPVHEAKLPHGRVDPLFRMSIPFSGTICGVLVRW